MTGRGERVIMEVEFGERVVLRGLGKANCYMMSLGKRDAG